MGSVRKYLDELEILQNPKDIFSSKDKNSLNLYKRPKGENYYFPVIVA